MNASESAAFRADLHKLACEIALKMDLARRNGHLSTSVYLTEAMNNIFKSEKAFKPLENEQNLVLL